MSALDKEGRLLDEGFPLPKWDAEAQLKWMDEAGIHTSVLTLAAPQPTSAKVVRATNEAAAKLKYEHPDRFRFCAALPLPDVDAAIEEARYAVSIWVPQNSTPSSRSSMNVRQSSSCIHIVQTPSTNR